MLRRFLFDYALKKEALGLNDSGLLVLDNEIADNLRGGVETEEAAAETTTSTYTGVPIDAP